MKGDVGTVPHPLSGGLVQVATARPFAFPLLCCRQRSHRRMAKEVPLLGAAEAARCFRDKLQVLAPSVTLALRTAHWPRPFFCDAEI